MPHALKRFCCNARGAAAVEFALLLPIMLIIWGGIVEIGNVHFAGRKVALSTQSIADLIAQERAVSDAGLANLAQAGNAVMFPYPSGNMSYQMQSIATDADGGIDATLGWQRSFGAAGDGGTAATPPQVNDFLLSNDSTIYVRVAYTYTPVSAFGNIAGISAILEGLNFTEEAFAKPRRINIIPIQ